MSVPPIKKTFEGFLQDLKERLDLVERRLAKGGGGGGTVDLPNRLGGPAGDIITLPAGTDLNTVLATGWYVQRLSAEATLARNYPVARAGHLEVQGGLQGTGADLWMQTYTEYAPLAPATSTRQWRRTHYNGAWTAWFLTNGPLPYAFASLSGVFSVQTGSASPAWDSVTLSGGITKSGNGLFTMPTDGMVQVNAIITLDITTVAPANAYVGIFLNGVAVAQSGERVALNGSAGAGWTSFAAKALRVVAGDTIEIRYRAQTTSPTVASATQNYMTINYVEASGGTSGAEAEAFPPPIRYSTGTVHTVAATSFGTILPGSSQQAMTVSRPLWVLVTLGAWVIGSAGETRVGVALGGATTLAPSSAQQGGTSWGQVMLTQVADVNGGGAQRSIQKVIKLEAGTTTFQIEAYMATAGTHQANYPILEVVPLYWDAQPTTVAKLEVGQGLIKILPTNVIGGTILPNGDIECSNVAALSLDGIFTTKYRNYRIVFSESGQPSGQGLGIRLRSGGADQAGAADYGNARVWLTSASANAGAYGSSSAWNPSGVHGTVVAGSFDVIDPMVAAPTRTVGTVQSTGNAAVGNGVTNWSGHFGNNNLHDGLSFFFTGYTFSGTFSVYAYA